MKKPNIVETKSQISIIFGKTPYILSKESQKSKILKVRKLIKESNWKALEALLNQAAGVEAYTKGEIKVADGFVKYEGDVMPEVLVRRLIEMKKKRISHRYLLNFWANLKKNPSEDSKKQLFGFLEANHFAFTQDGRFIGYKKVTSSGEGKKKKLLDSYSQTIVNNVGSVVKMERSRVNPDANQTCSYGLHVGAWGYVSSFSGDTIVEVLVNPKDVVAVPNDYNNSKMRVCEYEVFKIVKSSRTEQVVTIPSKAAVKKSLPIQKKKAKPVAKKKAAAKKKVKRSK